MSKYIGRLVDVGIAKESSRGAGATPTYHLPLLSLGFDDRIIQARSNGSLSKLDDSEEAFVTSKNGEGDFEGEIRSKSFGLLLYNLLGALSTSGPVDSLYTHTFTVSHTNQHQSLAIVVHDENTEELYKNAMLSELEITVELDQIVKYKCTFMSKKGVETTLVIPAVSAESKFTKKHLRFKVAADIASLGAATPISLKSLTLKISQNTDFDDVLGTAEPEDILNHQLSVEGELMLNYEDETWKNYMRNGTNKAMEIALINTDVVIGASSNPSLTFQLPKVDFFDWEPDYGLEDIVTQKISYKANRDVANNADIISSAVLKNDVTSY